MQTKIKYLLLSFIFLLTSPAFTQAPANKFVVVLDAGHGGKDPGRPTKFDTEKEIALKIVLALGKLLEQQDNVEVIYTRKKDVFVDLHERGAIANRADADLFISVHCNAHHTQAYGTETYVLGTNRSETNFNVAKAENEVIFLEEDYETNYEGYDPNSPESFIGLMLMNEDYLDQSILLASYVQDNFTNKLKRRNRGVKSEGFIVLHQTYMPSILIETGFITNNNEGAYLSSKKGQSQVANAIKDAVLKYKSELNENSSDFLVSNENNSEKPKDTEVYDDITFKVQIAASSRKLETKPFNFKGLTDISRERIGKIYRYFYGATSDYELIKSLKTDAIKKGYSTAFVVAFKNGERIPLNKVLK